jgi:hypothetical protein
LVTRARSAHSTSAPVFNLTVVMIRTLTLLTVFAALHPTLAAQTTFVVPGTHPTIQSAMVAASSGDTVLVLPGTYFENIDFLGKRIVLEAVAGPSQTTIDGSNGNTTVVQVSNSEPLGTTIRGFRIRGGKGRPFPSSYGFDYYGGGIFVGAPNTQLRVENCHLVDNALGTGTFGGGIHAGGQNVRVHLYGCLIRNNRAWASGGASLCEGQGSVMTFERCTVTGNTATAWAFGHQGGISVANYGAAVVKDCIVWGNAGFQMRAFGAPYNVGTSIVGTYSTVQGGFVGTGNLSADPQWSNAAGGDYTLLSTSPCIDAGDPASTPDADGTRADQGAFPVDQGPPGWVRIQSATSPVARNSHALAHDIARSVHVMFGGHDGTQTALGDTWEWDGSAWTQRSPANSPAARWGHALAYDARRNRTVMFGGFVPNVGFVDETWEYDGSTWTQIATVTAPQRRGYHRMAYDSLRGRAVVFGGHDAPSTYYGDVWEWDGASWTQRTTNAGPSPRRGAAVTYDQSRGELVVFGGGDGVSLFGDTWTLSGATWTQRTTALAPSPRWQPAAAFDPLCGKTLLHGGADLAFATDFADAWEWDGAAWQRTRGASPSARHGAAMAFDVQRGVAHLVGGRDTAGFFSDTWKLETGCARTMSMTASPRLGTTAQFRFAYPATAAGHLAWHFVTQRFVGSAPISLPGYAMVGAARVDLLGVKFEQFVLLSPSGTSDLAIAVPNDPQLVGFPFDVQSVDVDFANGVVYWAQNDIEAAVAQ